MTRTTTIATLAAALLVAAPTAGAQPITFEDVPTNAFEYNTTPFTGAAGFQFENWGVMTTANPFGTGTNATSGTKFAYGFAGAGGSSYIYRTDVNFHFSRAALSFRTFDDDVAPADVVVRGHRGADEVFTRTLTLTSTAQTFTFNFRDVDEIEFDTRALDGTRSAVLAIDDVAVTATPEPGTIVLTVTGLGLLAGVTVVRRRRA